MSKLDDFLNLADVSDIKKTIKVNLDGKNFDLVIRPITEAEHTEFQRRSNVISKNKISFDSGKYSNLVLEACIVEPNLYDKELQDSYGVMTPEDLLQAMVDDPGEYQDFATFVQNYNGFTTTLEDKVDEAKN